MRKVKSRLQARLGPCPRRFGYRRREYLANCKHLGQPYDIALSCSVEGVVVDACHLGLDVFETICAPQLLENRRW